MSAAVSIQWEEPAPLAAEATLRIALPGVEVGSPFAQRLAAVLSTTAELLPGRAQPAGWMWHRFVRGTALDAGGGGNVSAQEAAEPDLVLDLHGNASPARLRTWRIVDGYGNPIMQPFGCLPDADMVTSLYLLESRPGVPGSVALAKARISTRRRYRDLLETAGRAAAWLVARALRLPAPQPGPEPHQAAFEYVPRLPNATRFLAGRAAHLRTWLRDHVGTEIWAVGFVADDPKNYLISRAMAPDTWLTVPTHQGFIADPFPWPGHPQGFLCEYYPHRAGRGRLAAYLPDPTSGATLQLLHEPMRGHLSYPYTYEEAGTTYCLPEMAAQGYQALCILLPDGSLREHCIVAETRMADPTLFRENGRYWIAYSDAAQGMFENLCLCSADQLEGPWTPHPLNPVKIDARSSRPGGTPFRVGDTLFRPSQDCSVSYGHALVINRVITCTPENYEEVPVARLTPDPQGPYPDGLHTFSVAPDGILLDGKRIIYSPGIMMQRLRRRLHRPRS